MKTTKHLSTLICIFLLVSSYGCARQLTVTYNSVPQGAALYENDKMWGYCPVALNYPITPEDRKRGYKMLKGTEAKWISGATAKIDSMRSNLSVGTNQQFTFMRPTGVDGMDKDATFGLEVEKTRLMQQQVQAQRDANFLQMYNASLIQQQKNTPVRANCTSRVVGSTVYTDCN